MQPKPNDPPQSVNQIAEFLRRSGRNSDKYLQKYQEAVRSGNAKAFIDKADFQAQGIREEAYNNGTYAPIADIFEPKRAKTISTSSGPAPVEKTAAAADSESGGLLDTLGEVATNVVGAIPAGLASMAANATNLLLHPFDFKFEPIKEGVISDTGAKLLNTVTGIPEGLARTVQGLHGIGLQVDSMLGNTDNKKSQAFNKKLGEAADFVGDFMAPLKAVEGDPKKYADLFHDGIVDPNTMSVMMGQLTGFAASMYLTGGAGRLGMGLAGMNRARTAATLAGNVEKVAQINAQAGKITTGLRLLSSVSGQTQDLYEEGIKAGLNPTDAATFAFEVGLPVGMSDALFGLGKFIGGGNGVGKAVLKEAAGSLRGGLTPELMAGVRQKLSARLMEGARQSLLTAGEESVTETGQEAYQMAVESIYNNAGNTHFQGSDKAVSRLGAAGYLGFFGGGGMAAAASSASGLLTATGFQDGVMQPTAFRLLQTSYLTEGKAGMNKQAGELLQSARSLSKQNKLSASELATVEETLGQMQGVLSSFQNPYSVSPLAQYQYYDLAHNQLPAQQQQQQLLQVQYDALTADRPARVEVDDDGNIIIDQATQEPLITLIDPGVARTEAITLKKLLEAEQRRVNYLQGIQTNLSTTGIEQQWGKGYDAIGRYSEGEKVEWRDDSNTNQQGRIRSISDDGQVLEISQGENNRTQVSADKVLRSLSTGVTASPENTPTPIAELPTPTKATDTPFVPGMVDFASRPLDEYKPGESIFVRSDDGPVLMKLVRTDNIDDLNLATITVTNPDGQELVYNVEELLDSGDLLGGYNPLRVLADIRAERQNNDREPQRIELEKNLTASEIRAIKAIPATRLAAVIEQIQAVSSEPRAKQQLAYLRFRQQTLPDSLVQQVNNPAKSLATKQAVVPVRSSVTASPTAIGSAKRQLPPASSVVSRPVAPVILNRMVEQLSSAFPGIDVQTVPEQEMATHFMTADGRVPLGAFSGGTVYLNADRATLTTPLHEYAHVWRAVAKQVIPYRWKRGFDLVKNSPYVKAAAAADPSLTGEDLLEEALVMAIEDAGATLTGPDGQVTLPGAPTSAWQQFRRWMGDTFRKMADATGWKFLSPETTLEEWATQQAAELLSGKALSAITSEELAAQEGESAPKFAIYPANRVLPATVDNAFLRHYTLSLDQKKELYGSGLYANGVDAGGQLVRRRRDAADEVLVNEVGQQLNTTTAEGGVLGKIVRTIMRELPMDLADLRVIRRMLTGLDENGAGSLLGAALDTARRNGASVNKLSIQTEEYVGQALKEQSTYKNLSLPSSVNRQMVTGLDESGVPIQRNYTVSQAMGLAMQYHSYIAEYGEIPQQSVAGRTQEGLWLWNRQEGTQDQMQRLFVAKDELQRVEGVFFGPWNKATNTRQPTAWQPLIDRLQQHFGQTFGLVNDTHLLTEGTQLKPAKWYFPLRVARTKDGQLMADTDLNLRSISQLVEDTKLLKSRGGRPTELFVEDTLKVVERYNRGALQYVLHQPVVQNLKYLRDNYGQILSRDGRQYLNQQLEKQALALAAPNTALATQNNNWLYRWASNSIRLATLSRFAFNMAIPLKQFSGLTSAIGNGILADRYITPRLMSGFGHILQAQTLIGRGHKRGNYAVLGGADTWFDTMTDKVATNPFADTIYQRITGGNYPDIAWADLGGKPEGAEPGVARYRWGQFLQFEQEYGLAGIQRADSGVVLSLYEAAEAQVADETKQNPMTVQQQQQRIAELAQHALYYSNQTYDRTDRSSFQLDGGILYRMLGLYQAQGFKVFNTMNLRAVEAALTPKGSTQRSEAMQVWGKAALLNVVIGSLYTSLINSIVQAIRQVPQSLMDQDWAERDWFEVEKSIRDLVGSSFQNIPVLGDLFKFAMTKATGGRTLDAPGNVQLFEAIKETISASITLLRNLTGGQFTNATNKARSDAAQAEKLLRGLSEATGVSTEIMRPVAKGLRTAIEPETRSRPRRKKPTVSGWEIVTGDD